MTNVEIPNLKYHESGSGDPLVLLPGGLTGWLTWIRHAEVLAESRRVFRMQLHNVEYGVSNTPLPANYSVRYEAAALLNTLDHQSIEQADMAGWSYGSLIALTFALEHPHRVRSLTLIEPSAYWVLRSRGPLPDPLLDEQTYMRSLAGGEIREEQLIELLRVFRFIPEGADPRLLPQWPVWAQHRQSLRIGDVEYRHEDNIERLRSFDRPVLLVTGAEANPYVHAVTGVLADELKDARVVTLPGGHAAHLTAFQPFLDHFTRFLAERR